MIKDDPLFDVAGKIALISDKIGVPISVLGEMFIDLLAVKGTIDEDMVTLNKWIDDWRAAHGGDEVKEETTANV